MYDNRPNTQPAAPGGSPFGQPAPGAPSAFTSVNTSGDKRGVPQDVTAMGWSWGAFGLDWIWSFANNLPIAGVVALALCATFNIFGILWACHFAQDIFNGYLWAMLISGLAYLICRGVLGKFGHVWAWTHRHFPGGVRQFRDVQQKWSIVGGIMFAVSAMIGIGDPFILGRMFLGPWTAYASPAGYAVEFPSTPTVTTDANAHPPDGPQTTVECNMKYAAYVVVSFDYPSDYVISDPLKILQDSMTNGIRTMNGDPTGWHYMSIDGHPGIEYSANIPRDDSEFSEKDMSFIGRIVLVDHTQYNLAVVSGQPMADDHGRFFGSFHLYRASTPAPAVTAPQPSAAPAPSATPAPPSHFSGAWDNPGDKAKPGTGDSEVLKEENYKPPPATDSSDNTAQQGFGSNGQGPSPDQSQIQPQPASSYPQQPATPDNGGNPNSPGPGYGIPGMQGSPPAGSTTGGGGP